MLRAGGEAGRAWGPAWNLQLALDNQGSGADHPWRIRVGVLDDEDKVPAILSLDPIVPLLELVLADITNGGQHTETIEEPGIVVGSTQRPQLVALGQGSLDLRGEQVGREEALFGHLRASVEVEVDVGGSV